MYIMKSHTNTPRFDSSNSSLSKVIFILSPPNENLEILKRCKIFVFLLQFAKDIMIRN